MASIKSFEEIEAWQKARELTNAIYDASKGADFSRDFALLDQIRRAAVSVMSNIAEGFERNGDKEFVQFLSLAKGSCGEVRSQLCVALDKGYITPDVFSVMAGNAVEVSKLIAGLVKYLQASTMRGAKFK